MCSTPLVNPKSSAAPLWHTLDQAIWNWVGCATAPMAASTLHRWRCLGYVEHPDNDLTAAAGVVLQTTWVPVPPPQACADSGSAAVQSWGASSRASERRHAARPRVSDQARAGTPGEEAPQPAGARPAGRRLPELLQGCSGPPRRQFGLGGDHPHPVPLALVRPPPARQQSLSADASCAGPQHTTTAAPAAAGWGLCDLCPDGFGSLVPRCRTFSCML